MLLWVGSMADFEGLYFVDDIYKRGVGDIGRPFTKGLGETCIRWVLDEEYVSLKVMAL